MNQLVSTLSKLNKIGFKLKSNSNQILIPTKFNFKQQDNLNDFYKKLSLQIDHISNQSLISSLLAGPDNESDESIDVPIFLGHCDNPTYSLIDWSLDQLDIPKDQIQNITVREKVEISSKKEENKILSSENQNKIPWLLERIYKSGRISTESNNELINDSSLKETLSRFVPRIHFEFQFINHPSTIVCLFIGQLPILLSSNPYPTCFGGLISYRIES